VPKYFFQKFSGIQLLSTLRDTHIQNFREGSSRVPAILLRVQYTHRSKSSGHRSCWGIRCLNLAELKFLQCILTWEKLFKLCSQVLKPVEVWAKFLEEYFSENPHIAIYLVPLWHSTCREARSGFAWALVMIGCCFSVSQQPSQLA